MSRSLIIGIVATIAIISGLAAFFYINFVKVKHTNAVEAVPASAAIIFEVKDIQQTWATLQRTDMWSDLSQNESVHELHTFIKMADSLVGTYSGLQGDLADNHTVISFHANAGGSLGILLVAEAYGLDDEVEDLVKWMGAASGTRPVRRFFDKEAVYDFLDERQHPRFSVAYRNELLVLSGDGALVEESIRKLKYGKPAGDKGFGQAKSLAEVGADLNVYVNYKEFPSFLALFNKDEYKNVYHYISAFANWSVLNVELEKDHIGISGVTFTDDSLFQLLDLFKTQAPVEMDLSSHLPANTAYYLQFNFSNYPQFNSDLNEYLQNTGKLDAYTKYADSLEERYNISITDNLIAHLSGAALLGIHEGGGEDFKQQVFALLKVQDVLAVQNAFNGFAKAVANRSEADSSSVFYKGTEIKRLQLGNVLKLFYGHPFEHLQSPFYVVHNGVFVLANNLGTLQLILDELNNGNSLSAVESFVQYSKSSAPSTNVSVFVSPGKCFQLPAIYGSDVFVSALNRYAYDFKKFEFAGVQYASSSNNTFYTNINIRFNASVKEETKVLWQTKLDTTFQMQPVLLYNSERKQTCILVQDILNTVYFVSNSGEIIWKTKLSAKINSPVFEVDPNKNGEVHYLFSTNKMACLLSSKGVNVSGYPIWFPGTATAGINLFDFYADSTHQFFVPLQNNRVMGYNLNGKPVTGWNPKSIESKITTRVSYFRTGSGPYLCGTASSGQLLVYPLNTAQPKPVVYPPASGMFPVYVFSTDTTQATLWITDTTGNMVMMQVNSSLDFLVKQVIPMDSGDKFHTVVPVSSGLLVLAASSNGFRVYSETGNAIVKRSYTDSLTSLPFVGFTHNQVPMIGYTEASLGKLNWIDVKGNAYPTFPLNGVTPFVTGDVMRNKTNFLVCGDKSNNLILYRLK
jgi:hypothetical protein